MRPCCLKKTNNSSKYSLILISVLDQLYARLFLKPFHLGFVTYFSLQDHEPSPHLVCARAVIFKSVDFLVRIYESLTMSCLW
jgi:hypothetical protein